MLIIPLIEENLEFIAELNGGVTPEIKDEDTYFIYDTKKGNAIVTADEKNSRLFDVLRVDVENILITKS